MPNQNIEATKKGYEAFGAGDLEAALSVFDDSAVWTVNGESMLGGTYRGKAEITELLMRLGRRRPRSRQSVSSPTVMSSWSWPK